MEDLGADGRIILKCIYKRRRNAYIILVGKPEGKRLFGRPRSRWEILKWILGKYG
jgi:hypothetical protein